MNLDKIPTGFCPPWDVNVAIEISLGSKPVKYEVDPDSGAIFVDRFLHTACSIHVTTVLFPIPWQMMATRLMSW